MGLIHISALRRIAVFFQVLGKCIEFEPISPIIRVHTSLCLLGGEVNTQNVVHNKACRVAVVLIVKPRRMRDSALTVHQALQDTAHQDLFEAYLNTSIMKFQHDPALLSSSTPCLTEVAILLLCSERFGYI